MDRDFHVTAENWERFGCAICAVPADAEEDSSEYEQDTQGFSLSNKDYSSSEPPLSEAEDEPACPVVEESWDEWEDRVE